MGDQWIEKDLANSRYIWLPMTVNGEKVEIHNSDRWDFSVFIRLTADAR